MTATYVALGDSYAAGVGGGSEVDACWRAHDGYPVQVAAALGVAVAYDACLGATTSDVGTCQLDDLGPDAAYVSVTIGGNDIEFVPVLVAADELAGTIGAAASRAGLDFLDVIGDFAGHAVCDDREWLHGVDWPIQGSFHPNRDGHAANARLVAHRLGGSDEGDGASPPAEPRVVRGAPSRGSARPADACTSSTRRLPGAVGRSEPTVTASSRNGGRPDAHSAEWPSLSWPGRCRPGRGVPVAGRWRR